MPSPNRSLLTGPPFEFETQLQFNDRRTKAAYIFDKYKALLSGRLLDVGADQQHLAEHLKANAEYVGVGLGGNPDIEMDLESGRLPFDDGSFDCVLCFEVLEHLDNIHAVFDELCRVSNRYVVLSIPNAWSTFILAMFSPPNASGRSLKFYGLPPDKPEDRHKWFFSFSEAVEFVRYRSRANGMRIRQLDTNDRQRGRRVRIKAWLLRQFLARRITENDIFWPTLWVVLEKTQA